MTEITFHVNAPDKIDYACRFLRVTQKQSAQVLVVGPLNDLKSLSSKLWAMTPAEFLPHCFAEASPEVLAYSPIILMEEAGAEQPSSRPSLTTKFATESAVLLNLSAAVPAGFARFARLIEIVGQAGQAGQNTPDLQAARNRWKQYKALNYVLTRHDAVTKEKQVF